MSGLTVRHDRTLDGRRIERFDFKIEAEDRATLPGWKRAPSLDVEARGHSLFAVVEIPVEQQVPAIVWNELIR
jgi:hypothetical protein